MDTSTPLGNSGMERQMSYYVLSCVDFSFGCFVCLTLGTSVHQKLESCHGRHGEWYNICKWRLEREDTGGIKA